MRKLPLLLLLFAMAVGIGLVALRDRPASVSGCQVTIDSGPFVRFRTNTLEVSFQGHSRGPWLDELRGRIRFENHVELTARVELAAPLAPGMLLLEGTSMGTAASFVAEPSHAREISSATLNLMSSQGIWTPGPQRLSGKLIIEAASPPVLRGRLELHLEGDLSGCAGEASISTRFKANLR